MIKKLLQNNFFRFILIGLLNTIFGYAVFALLIFLGLHYIFAVFLATIIGVLFNFKTLGKLVFKNTQNKLIFKFITAYIILYIINIILIKIILIIIIKNVYAAGAIAVVITALFSYLLNSKWVFKKEVV